MRPPQSLSLQTPAYLTWLTSLPLPSSIPTPLIPLLLTSNQSSPHSRLHFSSPVPYFATIRSATLFLPVFQQPLSFFFPLVSAIVRAASDLCAASVTLARSAQFDCASTSCICPPCTRQTDARARPLLAQCKPNTIQLTCSLKQQPHQHEIAIDHENQLSRASKLLCMHRARSRARASRASCCADGGAVEQMEKIV